MLQATANEQQIHAKQHTYTHTCSRSATQEVGRRSGRVCVDGAVGVDGEGERDRAEVRDGLERGGVIHERLEVSGAGCACKAL